MNCPIDRESASLFDATTAHLVRARTGVIFVLLATISCGQSAIAANPPSFERVVQGLTAHFRSLPDFQRRDLLSQSQVAAALDAVAAAGWEVPNAKKIVDMALPDNSFLVGELSTQDGKKFMRKISQNPGTFSRLDRLSRLSQGQKVVSQLIGDDGGDVLITYLATTNGGRNLGEMLAGTPDGTDLNLPTGRIYTADDLLGVLKKVYKKEFGAR
jgi:hypothetical protein